MRFALLFPLIALGLAYLAAHHGHAAWILLWPALSFLLVGLAYTLTLPALFGKRPNGTLAPWSLLLYLPFFLYTWTLWHIVRISHRLHSREPAISQITPTLYLSRRPTRHEIPQGVTCIVDLTCEFPAAHGIRKHTPTYLSLPTLDFGTPPEPHARALLQQLLTTQGSILIHCAQGHGRSALLAAAYLVASGSAATPAQALQILKQTRPNIRLTQKQHALLQALCTPPQTNEPPTRIPDTAKTP